MDDLVYTHDGQPGWRRVRRGKHFAYLDEGGRPLRDPATLARIRQLAIPPAYTDVWICPLPQGHLQATGRDARGRKQYRYHPDWREQREQSKFGRLAAFGEALPHIRARVQADLASGAATAPTRARVLATVVRLLDTTYARVGNDAYARQNKSYGLTTLRNQHAEVRAGVLRLHFRGKSGIAHHLRLDDPQVARVVRRCQQLPGQLLFQYLDDEGQTHGVDSCDVNDYLADAAGERFTAKDFRTWHGSVLALALTRRLAAAVPGGQAGARSHVLQLVGEVARQLGNTAAVCRKSYIHPGILAQALLRASGDAAHAVQDDTAPAVPRGMSHGAARRLSADERRLLAFLATDQEAGAPAATQSARRPRPRAGATDGRPGPAGRAAARSTPATH